MLVNFGSNQNVITDTYRHKGLRRNLIESLRKKGINDEAVLSAMSTLPRHFYLDKAFEEHAYEDKAFPIGNHQTISQPYTVAYQTILLNVNPREKVLEIGTGSGYQASILSMMGGRVFTLERQEELYRKTNKLLEKIGFTRIRTYLRDGNEGLPEFAPFDKILVTAGATSIPDNLIKQLAVGGLLVIPVGGDEGQKMIRIVKKSDIDFEEQIFDNFRFVPFKKGINRIT